MGKLVEGLWDCPYCDTTMVLCQEKVQIKYNQFSLFM